MFHWAPMKLLKEEDIERVNLYNISYFIVSSLSLVEASNYGKRILMNTYSNTIELFCSTLQCSKPMWALRECLRSRCFK